MGRPGAEGGVRVPRKEFRQRYEPAVVDRSQRQRQARLAAGDKADHCELGVEPGVRLSRSINATRLLHEYELRRGGLVPYPLRRPARGDAISLGDLALSRPPVEQLCGPGPVLRYRLAL